MTPSFLHRVFVPRWESLGRAVSGQEVLSRKTALRWELVLQARHLPCRLRRVEEAQEQGGDVQVQSGDVQMQGWNVQVQPWFLERATEEIRLYIEENRPTPEPPVLPPPRPGELWPTMLIMLTLLTFHAWYTSPHPGMNLYTSHWLAAGSAKAEALLNGQWWRLFTALTLHGDGPHVVGNVAIGGVFIVLACRVLGGGLAWVLVMASGAVGNGINALVLGPPHDSIGFSTAVFGAAGVLVGVRMAEGHGGRFRRAAIPVGAGLGILAMLGTGGVNTDLGAHLFGFLAGLGPGMVGGWYAIKHGRPSRFIEGALYVLALGTPVVAWWVAFLPVN